MNPINLPPSMTMKTSSLLRRTMLAASLVLPVFAFGQGQLTPPGPAFSYPSERALNTSLIPIPSMKTLMHIDAGEHIPSRDPSKTNLDGSIGYYNLNAPGRYYLTENLSKRILITADNVTLDLGGFEVRYTGAGTGPIGIEAQSGVAGTVVRTKVINGRVRGAWQIGIKLGDDSVVSGVDVSEVPGYCIKVGKNSQVADSRVKAFLDHTAASMAMTPPSFHSAVRPALAASAFRSINAVASWIAPCSQWLVAAS